MSKQREQYHKFIKNLIQNEKYEVLRTLLNDLSAYEVANAMLQLKAKYQVKVLEILDEEKASEVLAEMSQSPVVMEDLLEELPSQRIGQLVEEMAYDDAADIVSIMNTERADEVMDFLPERQRGEIHSLLQYAEDTAGGIMNPYVIAVQKEQTIDQAIVSIQRYIDDQDDMQAFYTVYVVDEHEHLIGTVEVTQLLLTPRDRLISEVMNPDVIAVDVDLDQEEVVQVAKEYDLVVVPVIDKYLRLIGRITIDDLVDVIYEEHEEDIAQMSGTSREDVLESSVVRTVRERLPWLFLGMGGGFLTALVMSGFETSLAEAPQVAYFVPLIAALGGSIGIQSSSIVVRGLATGAIGTGDLVRRMWRELRVGFLSGLACALLLGIMTLLISGDVGISLTTPLALLLVLCFATVIGSSVPILLKRLDIDPALATGPFITTMNDIIGVSIYLYITFQASGSF